MKPYRLHAIRIFIIALLIPVIVSTPFALGAHATGSGYVTFDSFTGLPGSTIHVSGGGFTPTETVDIDEGTTKVTSVIADASGKFAATAITIPSNTAQGSFVIQAVGETSADTASNSYYVIPYTPTMSATSQSNAPFNIVHMKLGGFAPNEGIALTLATATATATADAKGSVSDATIQIPVTTPATYTITATGQTTGAQAKTFFYIGGFYPSASPSIYFLLPGQTLGFNGSGFANGETINVFEGKDTTTIYSTFTADNTGAFKNAGGFVIPFSLAGQSLTFHLVGQTSNATASTGASVGNFFASVSPSTYSLLPGSTLNFNGKGFYNGEKVDIYAGKDTSVAPLTTIQSDITGAFKNLGNITIPFTDAGTSPLFTFVGETSKVTASTSASVGKFYPHVAPSSYFVKPGDPFSFTGTGFIPGETVSVMIDKYQYTIGTITVDAKGNFINGDAFNMPYWAAGHTYVYHLMGNESLVNTDLTVSVNAIQVQVKPSVYNVKPGVPFTITGTGYVAGEKTDLQIGNAAIPLTNYADKMGTVTFLNITLPFGGDSKAVPLTITGETSLASASVSVTPASFTPSVTANTYYATPGQALIFTGTGFAPNESVAVNTGTQTITTLETLTTDTKGALMSNSFSIPFNTTGAIKMNFVGSLSGANVPLSVTVAGFNPQLSLSAYFQTPGSPVTIGGKGFAPNEIVTITGGTASTTATADAFGTFKGATLVIPFGSTKSFNIVATGNASNAIANASVGLASFSPSVTPNSFYQKEGASATFTGKGFVPGETIAMTEDGNIVTPVVADAKGNFQSDTYALPFATSAKFVFTGLESQTSVSLSIGLSTYSPALNLSTYYGNGGTKIIITGTGYLPGEVVNLTFDGTTIGSPIATTMGGISFPLTVPYAVAGNKAIVGTGATSQSTAKTSFNEAAVYTIVTLGAYNGKVGDAVTINGSGFIPGETVDVTTDQSNGNVTSFKASNTGTISDSSFIIPTGYTTGNLKITIKGEESLNPVTITYYVTN